MLQQSEKEQNLKEKNLISIVITLQDSNLQFTPKKKKKITKKQESMVHLREKDKLTKMYLRKPRYQIY